MKTLENKSMHFDPVRPAAVRTPVRTMLRIGVLLLLLTGITGMAKDIFMLHGIWEWAPVLVCGAVFGSVMILVLQTEGRLRWIAVAIPLAIILFCLIFSGKLWPSAAQMMNRILEHLQLRRESIRLPFDAQGALPLWGQITTAAAAAVLAAILVLYAGGFGWVLCFAVWPAVGMAYLDADLWLVLFCVGCALLPLTPLRRGDGKDGIQTAGGLLLLTALITAAVLLSGAYEKPELSDLRSKVTEKVHRLRYESAVQPLPEGNFSAGSGLNYSGETMLELHMSTPESLYLRGMAGADYGENGWTPRTEEMAVREADRVYWLEENGFSGRTQLACLADALELTGESVDAAVTVSGACRENLYLPPELESSSQADALSLRDGTVRAHGLLGKKDYAFSTRANLVAHADEMLDLLEERQDVPAVAEYLLLEENYRAFVYESYLDIPSDCQEILQKLPEMKSQPAASYDARVLIRSILDERAHFSRNAEFHGGGNTALSELLDGKPANSAQYAGAAVLMLRMLGVPARYAEGYLITPEMAGSVGTDASILLTGKDAHAWAEYYEDGIGWIPFETVPEYIGRMEEAGWRRFRLDEDALIKADSEQTETTETDETPQPETMPEDDSASQWENRELQHPGDSAAEYNPLLLLWIPAILLMLLVLCLIVRRKKILRIRKAEFDHPDLSVAISALFSYSIELMQHSGLQIDNAPLSQQTAKVEQWFGGNTEFGKMRAMNEEALFSSHTFAETQRSEMKAYEELTLARFKNKLNWRKRAYQQWICCMY